MSGGAAIVTSAGLARRRRGRGRGPTRLRPRTRRGRREAQHLVDRQTPGALRTARRDTHGDDRHQAGRLLDPEELLETRRGQDRRAHPAGAVAQGVGRGDQKLDGGADALQVGPGAQPVVLLARHAAQREQTVAVRLVGQAEHGDGQRRLGEEGGVAAQGARSAPDRPPWASGQAAISSRRRLDRGAHGRQQRAVVDGHEAPGLGVAGVGRQGGQADHLAHIVARHGRGREAAHAVAALDGGHETGKGFGRGAANHHSHMVPEAKGVLRLRKWGDSARPASRREAREGATAATASPSLRPLGQAWATAVLSALSIFRSIARTCGF